MSKTYKDYKIYCCFTLNRLVSELGIDLYQEGLEGKLDSILASNGRGLSKEEIKHEIRSNHFMTNKVLEKLQEDRLVEIVEKEGHYEVFITREGVVKKTRLSEFGNPRTVGIRAINIEKGDELIDVQVTDGKNDVVLATRHGMSIRFHEQDVRDMGRTATGVWGIALDKKDKVIDLVIIRRASTLLAVTEKGMGKRSELDEYRVQHRGGRGIITLKRNDKTGDIIALKEVLPDDELMMITKKGIVIRVPVEGIRVSGRNTQGVKVMNLTPGDLVVDVARIVKEEDEGEDEGDEAAAPASASAPKRAPPPQGKSKEKK